MYIFKISDKNKKFKYNGKWYKSPCVVKIETFGQIDNFKKILSKNGITNINIMNKLKSIHKHNTGIKKISILKNGTISLSTTVGS
jgi:hypothetical protein